MKFFGRLKWFGLGLSMGLLIVFAIFGTRGCQWTPTKRIKSAFQASSLFVSGENACKMQCYGIDNTVVYDLMYNGKVNFKDSQTKNDPKTYVLYNDDYKLGLELHLDDSTAVLKDFYFVEDTCDCPKDESLSLLRTPDVYMFSEMREKGIAFSDASRCYMQCYDITEAQVQKAFIDGKIDYSTSQIDIAPNPVYTIEYSINNRPYFVKVELGYKARVQSISGEESKSCGC